MPRYINENEIYALFDRRGQASLHVGDIDVLPGADVVEVVRGRWIETEKEVWHLCQRRAITYFKCSQCEQTEAKRSNYCPNCGAKMDLEGF